MITNQCLHCNPDQKRNCEECDIYKKRISKTNTLEKINKAITDHNKELDQLRDIYILRAKRCKI